MSQNNNTTIEEVKNILKASPNLYKGIDPSKIPQKVLLEFLLYHRSDVSAEMKKSLVLNLAKYGLLPQAEQKKTVPNPKPQVVTYPPFVSKLGQVPKTQAISSTTQQRTHKKCSRCPGAV